MRKRRLLNLINTVKTGGVEFILASGLKYFNYDQFGVCVGPFSTICWWFRKVPSIFFSKISFIFVVEFIFGWLTFWLKYFDYIFIRAKNAHMLSAELFYIGIKRKRNQRLNNNKFAKI